MSDDLPTPRTDEVYAQFRCVLHPAAMAYNSLCRELERENAKLREALYATTTQLEHVENSRLQGINLPVPATLTPDVLAAARKLL